jgi:hypothetical protein
VSHAHPRGIRTVVDAWTSTRVSCRVRLVLYKISSASSGLCPAGTNNYLQKRTIMMGISLANSEMVLHSVL